MQAVAAQLRLHPFECPVISVGGTNGKGSCVALLESMLSAQGYRVCAYTSPHLLRYNERIRVGGLEAADDVLCAAFARVEAARGDVPLTYFEFGTLAALLVFAGSNPQAVLLEVGLGGRLDAVNLVDADAAIVSSIGIDHTEWLGTDRESIGYEKAGIFRPGRAAVCGDPAPPRSLLAHAESIGTRLYCIGRDFRAVNQGADGRWDWQGWDSPLCGLPRPALPGEIQLRNAAVCVAALHALRDRVPVSEDAVHAGLKNARLPGRFQQLAGRTPVILDVAHNAEACATLAANLDAQPCSGRTLAVLGMLNDKPAHEVARIMDTRVHAWYLGGLDVSGRTQSAEQLARKLKPVRGDVISHTSIPEAYEAALCAARPGDRIVVFGSFRTVEAVLRMAA
jgi:dihydrofolate synthase/folylpolyglutamate synthase